ncbi:MAG: aminofutalosine synthase MqnE [Nitrospiraceae bacterium]|nr:aminofutalosine synthase MqnE [Nitrospiraceae bacterium]
MFQQIKDKILSGIRLTKEDGIALFESNDIFKLGKLASYSEKKKNANKVYYIRNIHVNPTNICVNRCKFCAFSRSKGEDGAYELTINEIIKKLKDTDSAYTEVHIVGGLHPDWPFEHYCEMLSKIKQSLPKIYIKAFTATEIEYFSRISKKNISDVLNELKKSGLDTMPGGGAEIFETSVRNQICPEKLSGEGWLDVMETAHHTGIKTNATMLYSHIEKYEHRIDHLIKLRDLQDKTHGFQAFIPLAYHPKNTEIGGAYSSGIDDLKTIAVSRLMLDNFPHIKAYWVMLGEKLSQIALLFGADDLDGTIIEEKITYSAGGLSRQAMTVDELKNLIKKAGKTPVERDSFYKKIN